MAEINLQAQWLLNDTDVPAPANQTLIQIGNGTAYLAFGHINPPTLEGPPDTQVTQEMLEGRTFPVVVVARVQMPIAQLIEMREKIDQTLAQVQAATPKP
jgi:hypothetical protein